MCDTSISLLERVSRAGDSQSWDRLVEVYEPLMRRWLMSCGVHGADADDLIQEVLAVVLQELPAFHHNRRTGAFRNWLRKVLVHRLQNLWRARRHEPQAEGTSTLLERLHQLADDASEDSRVWNREHDHHVIARLMELVRPRFQPKTWEAFRRQMFEGQRADVVARELDMPLSSVYVAKSRVLSALRREASGLVDDL